MSGSLKLSKSLPLICLWGIVNSLCAKMPVSTSRSGDELVTLLKQAESAALRLRAIATPARRFAQHYQVFAAVRPLENAWPCG